MKKIKRLLALFILCACIVIPFAGCGNENDKNNNVKSYDIYEDKVVIYFNEDVTSPSAFYFFSVFNSDFNFFNCETLEELLVNETFIKYRAGLSGEEYHNFLMRWTATIKGNAYTEIYFSDFTDDPNNIHYILVYSTNYVNGWDLNNLLDYIGFIEIKIEN